MKHEIAVSGVSHGAFVQMLNGQMREWQFQIENALRRLEVDHLEIWIEEVPSEPHRRQVSRLLDGVPVTIHGPFLQLSLCTDLEDLRRLSKKRIAEALEFGEELGASLFTVHAGLFPMYLEREAAFERLAESLTDLRSLGSVTLALENMPRRPGTLYEGVERLDHLQQMLKFIPDLAFTLDVGHCVQNGEDFSSFLDGFSDHVKNIHLHDAIRGERSHLALGAGQLPIQELIATLVRIDYVGFMALETISWADTEHSWKLWRDLETRGTDSLSTSTWKHWRPKKA